MSKQLAAYGKLGPDAVEPVGGWVCVLEVLTPRSPGKLAHHGECVAMAQDMATAKLLAAAPDLLAALKDILEVVAVCFDDFGNPTTEICQASDFSDARAALAKAEG